MNGLISYLPETDVAVARLDLFFPTTRGGGGLPPPDPYAYALATGLIRRWVAHWKHREKPAKGYSRLQLRNIRVFGKAWVAHDLQLNCQAARNICKF